MKDHWILKGREVYPVGMERWATWFETHTNERLLWQDTIGESFVSTMFLGLDHNYGAGPPLIFETLVQSGPLTDAMDRYSTYEQAQLGHIAMLTRCIEAERNGQSKS